MRDPNRIDPFMERLGNLWKTQCPDWRFGQLMFNATRVMKSHGTDIFYMEDDELLAYFEEWFDMKEHNRKIHNVMDDTIDMRFVIKNEEKHEITKRRKRKTCAYPERLCEVKEEK